MFNVHSIGLPYLQLLPFGTDNRLPNEDCSPIDFAVIVCIITNNNNIIL